VLRSLVGRLNLGKRQSELVDLLFGVTSFELHQMLCRAGRSSSTVESLMQRMALDAVSRYR
jgi:hypothetical protein